jgi:hypothetical protein
VDDTPIEVESRNFRLPDGDRPIPEDVGEWCGGMLRRDFTGRDFVEERRVRECTVAVDQRDLNRATRRIPPRPVARQEPREPYPGEAAASDDECYGFPLGSMGAEC